MALIQGRLSRIFLSDDAGANYAELGCLVDVTLNGTQGEIEATCHNDGQYTNFLSGRKDGTIDGNARYDEADAGQIILKDTFFAQTPLLVRFEMESGVTGRDRFGASAVVTSFTVAGPNDDIADLSFTMRLNGDFSPSAQP